MKNILVKMASRDPEFRRELIQKLAEESDSETKKKSPPGWKDFWKEKYEGGKKKVRNPDSKGKKSEVSANYLLKKDKSFQDHVYKEYKEWAEKNQDKLEKGSKGKGKKPSTGQISKKMESLLDTKRENRGSDFAKNVAGVVTSSKGTSSFEDDKSRNKLERLIHYVYGSEDESSMETFVSEMVKSEQKIPDPIRILDRWGPNSKRVAINSSKYKAQREKLRSVLDKLKVPNNLRPFGMNEKE